MKAATALTGDVKIFDVQSEGQEDDTENRAVSGRVEDKKRVYVFDHYKKNRNFISMNMCKYK